MKVLEIGGSGFVGSLINPYLKQIHELRVLDMKPPQDPSLEYVRGSVLNQDDLDKAAEGMDAVVYLAMAKPPEGQTYNVDKCYDIDVKGVHHALQAAVNAGIQRAVYTSTFSTYKDCSTRYFPNEDVRGDAERDPYGLTKRFGEEVCDYFSRSYGITTVVPRLFGPISNEQWHENYDFDPSSNGGPPKCLNIAASDLANAFDRAISANLPEGSHTAFFVTGDYTEYLANLSRGKEKLGWEPLERPQVITSTKEIEVPEIEAMRVAA